MGKQANQQQHQQQQHVPLLWKVFIVLIVPLALVGVYHILSNINDSANSSRIQKLNEIKKDDNSEKKSDFIIVRDGNSHNDDVLILTILKDKRSWGLNRDLSSHLKVLESQRYPRKKISLGFLVSDNVEFKKMETILSSEDFKKKGYKSVILVNKDFKLNVGRSMAERHDPRIQRARRTLLASARNALLTHALKDEGNVLWVDADIIKMYDREMLNKMVESKLDIITPRCKLSTIEDYDGNAWAGPRIKPTVEDKKNIAAGGLFVPDQVKGKTKHMGDFAQDKSKEFVKLDSVGGTVLFVKADVHRQGVFFPTEYIVGTDWEHFGYDGIETEGICYLAKSIGAQCWGMPHVVVEHDYS